MWHATFRFGVAVKYCPQQHFIKEILKNCYIVIYVYTLQGLPYNHIKQTKIKNLDGKKDLMMWENRR